MIDLPIAEDDEARELSNKILIFNHISGIIAIILLILSVLLIFQIANGILSVGVLGNFVIIVLGANSFLQILDIYSWYLINSQTKFNHEKALKWFIMPIFVDVILIFLFGLGILLIFLRISIFSEINLDVMVYDEDDPLFQNH